MTVRLLRTTHFQTGHPTYLGFLIHSCTSPNQSRSTERVAADLHGVLQRLKSESPNEEIRTSAKITQGLDSQGFSREAAKFLVKMAQDMGLLWPTNVWAWKGYVVNLVEEMDNIGDRSKEDTISSPARRIVYMKYYLESDGALMIHFVRRILTKNGLSKHDLRFNEEEKPVEHVFEDVISEYLKSEQDFRTKVRLQNFLGFVTGSGYKSKVRIHKAFPHLDTLKDLAIINYDYAEHTYIPSTGVQGLSARFLSHFPDVSLLDKIFLGPETRRSDFPGYYERAARLYDIPYRKYSSGDRGKISMEIKEAYRKIRDGTTGLASVSSIKDIVCTLGLVKHGILCEWIDISQVLSELRKEEDSHVRFHVNRNGEVEYVVMSS